MLLLPLSLYSFSTKGVLFSYTVTDNLYLSNIKEHGNITNINPFLHQGNFFDFKYNGNVSVINFETYNLVFENYFELHKRIYLPGVGNKNILYSNLYSFLPFSYEIYRLIEFALGDSLNIYLGNKYLFSPEVKIKYKNFYSDSISDYLEPSIKSSISIPLPYVFFIPGVDAGFKVFENEAFSFYKTSSHFYFPLTFDFSFTLSLTYYYSQYVEAAYPIPVSYADDPFFEQENLNQMLDLKIFLNKLFHNHRSQLSVDLQLFKKEFFEVENQTREDSGLKVNVGFTKIVDKNLSFSLQIESLYNLSSIQDFEYIKNSLESSFGLIF